MAREGPASIMTHEAQLDFSRIEYLLNPEALAARHVTIVGLGSGGAVVCDHLTMNGVRIWDLYDPDTLQPVNLVKHPRQRADVGRAKVQIQKSWILDRNPLAEVTAFDEDVLKSEAFETSVQRSDVVLSCPDTKSVREYVNDICVRNATPMVTASVFRTGIGGEIFAYIPGETGCFQCLQLFALSEGLDLSDDDLNLTKEESARIYGVGETNFQASGLSIDIQMIALIQARMALSLLLRGTESPMALLQSNWIIFGNRPTKGIFQTHFEARQMRLVPQRSCMCATQGKET